MMMSLWARLTRREREAAELLLEGYNNCEIATHLKVSTHTIFNRLRRIAKKCGIGRVNRVRLAVLLSQERCLTSIGSPLDQHGPRRGLSTAGDTP